MWFLETTWSPDYVQTKPHDPQTMCKRNRMIPRLCANETAWSPNYVQTKPHDPQTMCKRNRITQIFWGPNHITPNILQTKTASLGTFQLPNCNIKQNFASHHFPNIFPSNGGPGSKKNGGFKAVVLHPIFEEKIGKLHTHARKHTHWHRCTYIHTYIHTFIHSFIHYIHTYIHTYIHAYIHACKNTYIHTYIHAYILDGGLKDPWGHNQII